MISKTNFTRKIVICTAISLGLLPSNPANAASFKIGNVKRAFPTDSACVFFNPKTPEKLILVELGKSAWVNVNSKDIELKLMNKKNINSKKIFTEYQGREIVVTIDATFVRLEQAKPEDIPTEHYKSTVKFERGNNSMKLKLNGRC